MGRSLTGWGHRANIGFTMHSHRPKCFARTVHVLGASAAHPGSRWPAVLNGGGPVNAELAIFIGSSSEAAGLAAKIASAIAAAGMSPVAWNMGAFPAGQTLIERIESFPHEFDGAVLLATPDLSCARQGKSFVAPASNVIFEYGYLSSRLTRRRVVICRFGEAEIPSDVAGVKVIEGGDVDYEAAELPQDMEREIASWLAGLPRLAAGTSPVMQSHGYSGWWRIDNRFDQWRGLPVEHPDSIFFTALRSFRSRPTGSEAPESCTAPRISRSRASTPALTS